ncbi:hypothetical protein ABXV18_24905 [Vibrio owensii]|uniref:hypothetical protein n=1 Tax=Vibrio owensii TaxID=696485 RepID=UPI00339B4A39
MSESKKKILPAKDYRTICQMWRSGDYTLSELAKKFDTNEKSLRQRLYRDGIKKGQDAKLHDQAVSEVLQKETAKNAVETRNAIATLQKNHLSWLDQISKRALFITVQSAKEETPLGNFKDDIKALKDVSDILRSNYQTAAKILRVDDITELEEELPTFTVAEMTADDVAEIRDAQRQQLDELLTGDVGSSNKDDDEDDIMVEE